MGRTGVLVTGLIGGIVVAGIGVGLLIPLAPDAWRTEAVVWGSSAAIVALCVAGAFLFSRPSRE